MVRRDLHTITDADKQTMSVSTVFGDRTINELTLMFRNRQINLEPGFQRRSVWTRRDRRRLVESIASNYPVPSIFLYKRNSRGRIVYDVIDGKQRLETIFMFTGIGRFKRDQFDVRLDLGDGRELIDWPEIRKHHKDMKHDFESYKIQTVEVVGNLAEIVDLFVRINSTGKPLTSGEKRHAKFYESRFLKEAERLVRRYQKYLLRQRILSQGQIDRMKGTELFSELLMSIHTGGIINKKTALDRALGNDTINLHTLGRVSRELVATLNTLKRMFPELRQTRFRNTADFYSLLMSVWAMRGQGFVLNDRKRNAAAWHLLRRVSDGVDELRIRLRAAKSPPKGHEIYRNYLLTVQGDTDSAASRQRRAEILRRLLFSLFDVKDDRRSFSIEQRRLIWNKDERKSCKSCRKQLLWDDFTIDHKRPYSRGGRTILRNAQLMCRRCNSRKRDR